MRFEVRQVYDAAIQTQMNYHNSLGDTIELRGEMPESYDGSVNIYYVHVWDHYGFRFSTPDEESTEKEKSLLRGSQQNGLITAGRQIVWKLLTSGLKQAKLLKKGYRTALLGMNPLILIRVVAR